MPGGPIRYHSLSTGPRRGDSQSNWPRSRKRPRPPNVIALTCEVATEHPRIPSNAAGPGDSELMTPTKSEVHATYGRLSTSR